MQNSGSFSTASPWHDYGSIWYQKVFFIRKTAIKHGAQQTFPFIVDPALTCEMLVADAGIAALFANAGPSIAAGIGVTEVDLHFTVVSSKALGAATAQACDRVDGSEEGGWGGYERSGAIKLEH